MDAAIPPHTKPSAVDRYFGWVVDMNAENIKIKKCVYRVRHVQARLTARVGKGVDAVQVL